MSFLVGLYGYYSYDIFIKGKATQTHLYISLHSVYLKPCQQKFGLLPETEWAMDEVLGSTIFPWLWMGSNCFLVTYN